MPANTSLTDLEKRIKAAAKVARGHAKPKGPCKHLGETLRTVTHECCGEVNVFLCPQLGHEVESTKCVSCREHEPVEKRLKAWVVAYPQKGSIANIQKALVELGFDVDLFQRGEGAPEWVPELCKRIKTDRPDLFVCFQRLYGGASSELGKLLKEYAVPEIYMDFGVWPHYGAVILDPLGENATSELVGNLDSFELAGYLRKAADEQAPLLAEMKDTINRQAEAAEADLSLYGLDGLPDDFVFLCLQRSGDMVLRLDAEESRRDTGRVMGDFIAEAKRQDKFVVIKMHPFDEDCAAKAAQRPQRGKHYRILPRVIENNENAMAWLLKNCAHMATVNSTVTFSALAAGCKVVTLGKGWFTGNKVTAEYRSILGGILGPSRDVEQDRADRFLLHALSRQITEEDCLNPELVGNLLRARRGLPSPLSDVTTITCVYAPDLHMEHVTRRCLWALMEHAPESPKIAAIDLARDEFVDEIEVMGFTIVRPDPGGSPPRMASLLQKSLERIDTRFAVTVESDVFVNNETIPTLLRRIGGVSGGIAGVEATYVNSSGAMAYPTTSHQKYQSGTWDPQLKLDRSHICWACAIFDCHALTTINWDSLPQLCQSDVRVGRRLRDNGYKILRDYSATAEHMGHQSIRTRNSIAASDKTGAGAAAIQRSSGYGDVLLASSIARAIGLMDSGLPVAFRTKCPGILLNNPDISDLQPPSTRFHESSLSLDWAYEKEPWDHAIDAYLEAARLSATITPMQKAMCRPKVYPSEQDRAEAANFLPAGKWVTIHSGPCGWSTRKWPMESWVKLCKFLRVKGYKIAVLFDAILAKQIDAERFFNKDDSLVCASVIERSSLFVGIDSCPSHFGQCVKTPSVILFGPVKPESRLHAAASAESGGPGVAFPVTPHGVECAGCAGEQPRLSGDIFCRQGGVP